MLFVEVSTIAAFAVFTIFI